MTIERQDKIQFGEEYIDFTEVCTVIPLRMKDEFVVVEVEDEDGLPYISKIHYTVFESDYQLKN